MSPIRERLASLDFFFDLDPATIDAIAERGLWFSLAGGWELFAEGSTAQTLFFVLSGRLIVVRSTPLGEEVVGYVRSGEPVGEMALLSGEAHSASVYALRDTELLALPRLDFDDILESSAVFAGALARSVLKRARHPRASFQKSAPRVFAIIASSRSIDPEAHAADLSRAIARYGLRVCWYGEKDAAEIFAGFEARETTQDIVLMAARIEDTSWYRFALRHADRFLVLARRDARPDRPFPLSPDESSPARRFRLVDLVMLDEGVPTTSTFDWADAIEANRIFHLGDMPSRERLARIVAGKSVALVLSGGGARAYAHIGAIRALRERGVPIDFVCGASMGAIIAACFAMGWSDDEIERRIREGFVASNPLGDHVLPVVALTRGGRVEERLQRHFGDARIEDLATPFFCVSSDLVTGKARVHRWGLLRAALRASISLPGILPPVIDGEALLVDGAVVDNFPIDLMAGLHRGVTIGIDVAQAGTIRAADFAEPPGFFQWVRRNGFSQPPPIVSLLMRAATARRERTVIAHPADIMIAPEASGVQLRDWKKFEPAVADGYAAAMRALDERWADLAPIVEAAQRD